MTRNVFPLGTPARRDGKDVVRATVGIGRGFPREIPIAAVHVRPESRQRLAQNTGDLGRSRNIGTPTSSENQ
jgi:hypothetical protein